jgi:predicted Zn finger-like uncharacterized protein
MYTQCPDCGTAFRVTAEVLKQAAGKVRCGGCGVAFNALDYLSEHKPATSQESESDASVPELTADPPAAGDKPAAISAAQSAALLKTLDELAGEDIRIEDTGVEWRVLDETDDSGERPVADVEDFDDTGSMKWFLDESPTPVDEPLSAEPAEIDAPEIFADEPDKSPPAEEMRFDDDTPLPEDFDFDAEPATPEPQPQIETRDAPPDLEEAQVDIALGEPEDWEDLLGEVGEAPEPDVNAAATEFEALPEEEVELEIPAATGEQDVAGKDEVDELVEAAFEEPIPDVDKQFDTLAEAMGIDLSGMHERLDQHGIDLEAGEEEARDIEETSIDDDLIAAAFEVEAEERSRREAAAGEESLDEDSLEAMAEAEDDEQVAGVEIEEPEHNEDDDEDDYEELEFELDLEEDLDLVEARDRELVVTTEADAKLAAELGLDDEPADDQLNEEDADKPEQVVPPMTEEEQTVNMMIDEDLLAIAVTDEEGFASTIVQKQDAGIAPAPLDDALEAEKPEADIEEGTEEGTPEDDEVEAEAEVEVEVDEDAEPGEDQPDDDPSAEIEQLAASEGALVETIIMEGEFIRDLEEEEKLEEARRKTGDPSLKSAAAAEVTDLNKDDEKPARPPVNWGLVAGITVLVALLLVQILHQSREALAVNPAFNGSVGALYRVLGSPITPNWDISGWRIEKTRPDTQGQDSLTIYSQIGNKSDDPLPYPLINVSLTNRYQDVIGSRLLEPGDYLPDNLDTRELVAPGTNFAALFSIETPDADIHGYKLDVCYRLGATRLKCAVDDFK